MDKVNTKMVSTNIKLGMTINMECSSMKDFLTNLAISTIIQCREIVFYRYNGANEGSIRALSNLPYCNNLISTYCADELSAVLLSMVNQNATILYEFIQDCVENGINKNLDLLDSKSKYGKPFWKLILQALDEYTDFLERKNDTIKNNIKIDEESIKYNKYNKDFEVLMNDS